MVLALSELSQIQCERLAFIEFRLLFLGRIGRLHVCERFGITSAAATRDFRLYKSLAPSNLALHGPSKQYCFLDTFVPLFEFNSNSVLNALVNDGGYLEEKRFSSAILHDSPSPLNKPDVRIVASITRAIHMGHALIISYLSNSSGLTSREIVPQALVNSGLRWHVRSYDRLRGEFRDFVLTRILGSAVSPDGPFEHESLKNDSQWNCWVNLELVAHPQARRVDVVERDFGMTDGVLVLETRASMAGYLLRRWNVDCSANHSLEGHEYVMWLRNHEKLSEIDNALLAPGFGIGCGDVDE